LGENELETRRAAKSGVRVDFGQGIFDINVDERLCVLASQALLARVLERSPEHAEAWLARGFVARRDGRFEDALRALRRALEIVPLNREGLIDLGHTLAVLGRFDEAAATLTEATRAGADVSGQWTDFGLLRGDPEAAWAAVDGPAQQSWLTYPHRAALATRDPQRIALALSPALWPEALHGPSGYSEAHALA
jgi:tetratricopeptide (TPR) repeat protein